VSGYPAADEAENPFAAVRVRPGAIPFVFSGETDAARLVERLRRDGWRGQIVGPHGSGKSALLATLVPVIERAGRRVVCFELHDGAARLPRGWRQLVDRRVATLLAIDGYEQLTRWHRYQLTRFCRRAQLGLVVTSHAPVDLPDLFHTNASLELAEHVVAVLQRDHRVLVLADDVAGPYRRHGGDLRETLFDLYDLYERRRRTM